MNTPRLLAGAASLSAAVFALTAAAFAQTPSTTTATTTSDVAAVPSDGSMMMTTTSGQNVLMVGPKAGAELMKRATWAFYNADKASVNRYKAMGFTESEVKEILNLSWRTGLEPDYIVRRVKDSGYSFRTLAEMYGVNPKSLDDDLPGFNADAVAFLGEGYGSAATTLASTTSMTTTTTASSAMAAKGDIMDVAASDPQLSTFVAAVRAAGLESTFKGAGPYTVFARTNSAFAKLPAGTLDDLLKPENKDKLIAILQNHMISGKVTSKDLAGMTNPSMPTTAGGGSLTLKTTSPIMINDASLVQPDVMATNGVIHLIDTILLPAGVNSTGTTPAPAPVPTEPTPTPAPAPTTP